MDQIKIGKYIQQLRKTKGLTQKQLAEQLNISFQAVSKWELGETLPDTSIILQLCEILETNADMLLHGGTYFAHNRKLIRIKDVDNGLKAIEDVKKYFGEKSLFYIGMIEGINAKMNIDIESYLNNSYYREVLIAEVLLQSINSGQFFVDMKEVKEYFTNQKMIEYINQAIKKSNN